MSITAAQKSDILHLIKEKYPDWQGFGDTSFRRAETNHKRNTARKATSLLSESILAQLLVTRDTQSFIDRLHHLGEATDLLKSHSESMQHGDLEILHIRTLDKPVFCAQMYHLLHGSQSIYERLNAYLHYIEEHELPNTWTFPTYFLQFCFPDSEIFVETRSTQWLLKFLGISSRLGKPSSQTYREIKDIVYELKKAFTEYKPQDLIDIQSMIHICGAQSEPVPHSSTNGHLEEDSLLAPQPEKAIERNLRMHSGNEGNPLRIKESSYDSDPTMLRISEVSDESKKETLPDQEEETYPRHALSLQIASLDPNHRESLQNLYNAFIENYMSTPAGVARAVGYARAREQAELNFSHLIAEHELGEIVTDRVFLHLLPHEDTPENQSKGAWIHPIGSASEALIASIHRKYPPKSPIRPQVAEVLLEFIRHCVYKTNALDKSSEALARLDSISIIDLPSITPILHALKPNQYVLLHEDSVAAINRLLGTSFEANLQKLPELNAAGIQLIRTLQDDKSTRPIASVQDSDLFDIFCHWLSESTPETHLVEVEEHFTEKAAQTLPDPSPAAASGTPSKEALQVTGDDDTASLAECARKTAIPVETLASWEKTLNRKGQIIFRGPSGTGKTFLAQHFANAVAGASDGIVQLLQFHPDITHSAFWGHEGQTGVFQTFCEEAAKRSGNCLFIIDEIDQADIREVFGHLLYRLEYRSEAPVTYAYNQHNRFIEIPDNVFIIGTMCPHPDSLLINDPVIIRRFAFIPVPPNYDLLRNYHDSTSVQLDGLITTLTQINNSIEQPHLQIGTTAFLKENLAEQIESIWTCEIEPALELAFGGDIDRLNSFRWNQVRRRILPG